MLLARTWKTDAVLRLGASVLLCMVAVPGLGDAVLRFTKQPQSDKTVLFIAALVSASALLGSALWSLRRPLPAETFMRSFLSLFARVYGGLLLAWAAAQIPENGASGITAARIVIGVLGFQCAALVLVFRFVREHGTNVSETFGFRVTPGRAILGGILFTIVFLPIGWILQATSVVLLEQLQIEAHEQAAVEAVRTVSHWGSRAFLGFVAVLLAPAAEEVLFRGVMYPFLKGRGFPRLALWASSLLFGLIHFNVATIAPLTVLALGLVWLYERTGNLLAPIVAHSLFNGVNFALLSAAPWIEKYLDKMATQGGVL